MHDRPAFKGARALVARIPAHTAPVLHSRAPYHCPTTASSLSGPIWVQPRALLSCSCPCQSGAADQARFFASQAPSYLRQAHRLGPMGLGRAFCFENPAEPASFFLLRAFSPRGPPISVCICPYPVISVYILKNNDSDVNRYKQI